MRTWFAAKGLRGALAPGRPAVLAAIPPLRRAFAPALKRRFEWRPAKAFARGLVETARRFTLGLERRALGTVIPRAAGSALFALLWTEAGSPAGFAIPAWVRVCIRMPAEGTLSIRTEFASGSEAFRLSALTAAKFGAAFRAVILHALNLDAVIPSAIRPEAVVLDALIPDRFVLQPVDLDPVVLESSRS